MHDILEILYFICAGPVLLIVASIGLYQIIVSKESAKIARKSAMINSKREAFRIAAEQCDIYLKVITPMQDDFDKIIISENLEFISKAKVTITNSKISIQPCKDKDAFNKFLPYAEKALRIVNAMESFALYFISGVASEEVAYPCVSVAFCNAAKQYMPFFGPTLDSPGFRNLVNLFILWNNRMEKESLITQKEALEKQLQNSSVYNIDPIGATMN